MDGNFPRSTGSISSVLGKPIHHSPSLGGKTEKTKYDRLYQETLATYQIYFGIPPADIWLNHSEWKSNQRWTFLAQDLHSQNLVIIKILRFDLDFEWDDLKCLFSLFSRFWFGTNDR